MKKLSFIPLLIFLLVNIQCGGGGDRTYSGTTPVSIKVTEITDGIGSGSNQLSGAVMTRDLASAVADGEEEGRQLSLCRITITGPGMADMVREVDVAGKSSIRETFMVPSGLNRSFLIQMFIENNDTVIVQAKSAGKNLEGKYMEILMEPTRQADYFEAPEFSGILSVSNAETRSVMLNWKPATDNITDQKRIQYLIYLTTQSKRDQNADDIFKAYEPGTGTKREEDSLLKYYYVDDEQFISYEYVGAIPESENTLAGVVSEQTVSGRLVPGVPYLFMVRASDEWGFPEDNMVESDQITVYMLDVEVLGNGTVTSEPKGIECGTKCSEDFISKEGVTLTAIADEGAVFNGWSGSEKCYGTDVCTFSTLAQNESVTATFTAIDSCLNGETDCSVLNDECNAGECDEITGDCIKVPANEGVGCDDGQYCTEGETCQSGTCTGGSARSCPDGTICIESLDTCEDNCTDNDGDTYAVEGSICGAVDCDDANGDVHPGAAEVCNGIDDNCDGGIDETGDALCDNGSFCDGQETCSGINGCQIGSLPCTDGTTCNEIMDTCDDNCTDIDGDTYAVEGGSCGPVDCDDANGDVHPGAAEVCNGVDDNCVNGIDETGNALCDNGLSCDGQETCGGKDGCLNGIPIDCSSLSNQCNSGECDEKSGGCIQVPANEGQACDDVQYCTEGETCQSGVCAGGVDPCPTGTTCIESSGTCKVNCTDKDQDGYAVEVDSCGPVDCDDNDNTIYPGATESCDGKNNDCNDSTTDGSGESWYGDACDGPDSDLCKEGSYQCSSGTQTCSDNTSSTKEICDGKDNDCNSKTADGSGESWYGESCDGPDSDLCKEGSYQCSSGTQTCSDNTSSTKEICDGKDNDCNSKTADGSGESWYGDACDGPDSDLCKEGSYQCSSGTQTCSDNTSSTKEICDGKDNDCNSKTTDGSGESWYGESCDGPDSDLCKEGSYQCSSGTQTCSDNTSSTKEICDGKDNDCNSKTTDGSGESWYGESCDGPDSDLCKEGSYQCSSGTQTCSDNTSSTKEICDGKDNDCNSKTADGSGESWYGESCDGPDSDLCKEGSYQCSSGTQTCSDNTSSTKEICDGKDNDCDGKIDEGVCGPDLIIQSLQLNGKAYYNDYNEIRVPIRVVVKNQGTAAAGIFKTSTSVRTYPDTNYYVRAFTVSGQKNIWYPWTSSSLGGGSTVTFNGYLSFTNYEAGNLIYIRALADSCSGDEFMPSYCRVNESNENNNESTSISLTLPY